MVLAEHMNHCVPDCDEFGTDKGGESESVLKCSRRQDSTKLSENDFSELVWTTDGDLVMQVGGRSLQWFARQNEDRLAPSKPPSDRSKEGTLDAVVSSVVGTEQSISQSYADEDDLISWLQYPEDTLEKGNNCSDIFTPASTQLQFFKEPVIQPAVCEIPQKDSDREATMPRTEGLSVLPPPQTSESVISLSVGAIPQWSPSKKTDGGLASMLPPKPQKSNVVQSSNALNFSHFSRPAAIAKASLHTLGKCSTSITSHFQDQYKKSDVVTVTSNVEGSIESATTQSSIDVKETVRHQSSDKSLSHSSLKSCTSRKEAVGDVKDNNPSTSAAAEANEQTLTSSSGGSGNSADRKCSSVVAGKRKSKDVEDSTECQSEDVEGESVDVKKTPPARSKRSRAAEVHNLSERRRRDRINEKMKALQELIPNSNKTDKASMLDEAIEYLKMLQLQLQMMSMRSGLSLPPMIIPAGMQMPQVSTLPHVGMGMGVGMGLGMGIGMGMGMGLMDAASVRPVMPLPLAAGSGQPSNAPMPVNMEVYHAYMLQQQFQHQQMQLRHQHIQQQQHQHIQQQQQQQQTQPQTQTQQHQQQQKNN